MFRKTPGVRRTRNYFGFPSDYNPLVRPWYVGATGGPKDVVIVLDCSSSMNYGGRSGRAIETVQVVVNTLTENDRFNVICAQGSYYRGRCGSSECGESSVYYQYRSSYVMGCKSNSLQRATSANKKQILSRLSSSIFDGAEGWNRAVSLARTLLDSTTESCDKFVFFVTDGFNTDGSSVQAYSHTSCDEDNQCTDYYSEEAAGVSTSTLAYYSD